MLRGFRSRTAGTKHPRNGELTELQCQRVIQHRLLPTINRRRHAATTAGGNHPATDIHLTFAPSRQPPGPIGYNYKPQG
ncbi:Hypothetical predicted protein, partial [Pelobates cultripes]